MTTKEIVGLLRGFGACGRNRLSKRLAAAAIGAHGQHGEDQEGADQRSGLNDNLHNSEPYSRPRHILAGALPTT